MDEDQARAAKERYTQMEVTLPELWQQNQELMARLQEKENIVTTKRLCADRRSRAQTQESANLTAELLVGRQGPKVQIEGMRLGVKVEKPDVYSGKKGKDLDT